MNVAPNPKTYWLNNYSRPTPISVDDLDKIAAVRQSEVPYDYAKTAKYVVIPDSPFVVAEYDARDYPPGCFIWITYQVIEAYGSMQACPEYVIHQDDPRHI